MRLVSEEEQAEAQADVAAMIEASGLVAALWRRTAAPESRYGEEESEYTDTNTRFPFEWRPKPKESLPGDTPDAEIHVLPDVYLKEEDRLVWNGQTFKVLNVVPENLFGVVTHQLLRLARVYDGS